MKIGLIIISIIFFGIGIFFVMSRNNTRQIVTIKDYAFSPMVITVKKGTTVTWINKDIAAHTITKDTKINQGPESEYFVQNKEYSYTFGEIGTYDYHCDPHPYMKGKVEVIE